MQTLVQACATKLKNLPPWGTVQTGSGSVSESNVRTGTNVITHTQPPSATSSSDPDLGQAMGALDLVEGNSTDSGASNTSTDPDATRQNSRKRKRMS